MKLSLVSFLLFAVAHAKIGAPVDDFGRQLSGYGYYDDECCVLVCPEPEDPEEPEPGPEGPEGPAGPPGTFSYF